MIALGGAAFGLRAAVLAVLIVTGPALALAQDARTQTLADIRAELAALSGELQRLRAELAQGSGPSGDIAADTVLERVERMERAVQQLTAQTEELGFRIDRVVADGTNRIADIEFRLGELEGGDPAAAPPPAPLGGEVQALAPPPAAPGAGEDGPFLAVGEQAAFDEAAALHAAGDWAAADAALGAFTEAFPVGPLTPRAHLLRAEARAQLGDRAGEARSALAAFNADQSGPEAPAALLVLGSALASLQQTEEACIMLDELQARFADSPQAADAADTRAEIGCP
ncbi:MAG: tol-pal system protein [Alkalilacustris sp.]